jgi:hypothetical protein
VFLPTPLKVLYEKISYFHLKNFEESRFFIQ